MQCGDETRRVRAPVNLRHLLQFAAYPHIGYYPQVRIVMPRLRVGKYRGVERRG